MKKFILLIAASAAIFTGIYFLRERKPKYHYLGGTFNDDFVASD